MDSSSTTRRPTSMLVGDAAARPPQFSPTSICDNARASQSTRKKGGSFLNFLTVREPSSQALHEYQESLRKQKISRGLKPSAVGMAMVSSAKLPPDVPKVNSKWEGVPKVLAQKEKEKTRKTLTPSLSTLKQGRSNHSGSSQWSDRSEASLSVDQDGQGLAADGFAALNVESDLAPRQLGLGSLSQPMHSPSAISSTTGTSFSSWSVASDVRTPHSETGSFFFKPRESPPHAEEESSYKAHLAASYSNTDSTCAHPECTAAPAPSLSTPYDPTRQAGSRPGIPAFLDLSRSAPSQEQRRGVLSMPPPPSPKMQYNPPSPKSCGPPSPTCSQKLPPSLAKNERTLASHRIEQEQPSSKPGDSELSSSNAAVPLNFSSPTRNRFSYSHSTSHGQRENLGDMEKRTDESAEGSDGATQNEKVKRSGKLRLSLFSRLDQ